ncbi:MAG: endo-1,4-beta-xylanase [Pirellulales bacterium]
MKNLLVMLTLCLLQLQHVYGQDAALNPKSPQVDQAGGGGDGKAEQDKLSGDWHCQFETPLGLQTYHLHVAFGSNGEPSVRADVESDDGKRSVQFTDSVDDLNQQAADYARLFAIFKKHEDVIERVTFWGLNDRRTWRRGQHPLLFDSNNHPKPAYASIVKTAAENESEAAAGAPRQIKVEDGGQGPYSAIATESPTLVGMTIYRPLDLSPFGSDRKLPVILWGNGACANTTEEHKNFLNEIASHGYLVLGIGLLDQLETRGEASRQRTNSAQLLAALDWIIAENASQESVYAGKIDVEKVAAMGMSCGGLQAIEISSDPRITTTVVCNSGVLPSRSPMAAMPNLTKDDLKKLHGPVLYLMGGPKDIAYKNAMDDFSRIDHVPVVMVNLDVGHGGTYRRPHGGEYSPVALGWLDWHLKGTEVASKMFLGEESELKRDPKWTIETKNFKD